jgi:hypothetical protein
MEKRFPPIISKSIQYFLLLLLSALLAVTIIKYQKLKIRWKDGIIHQGKCVETILKLSKAENTEFQLHYIDKLHSIIYSLETFEQDPIRDYWLMHFSTIINDFSEQQNRPDLKLPMDQSLKPGDGRPGYYSEVLVE